MLPDDYDTADELRSCRGCEGMNLSVFQRNNADLHHLRILPEAFGLWESLKSIRMWRKKKKKWAYKNHHNCYCQNLILLRQQKALMLHWICPFLCFSLPLLLPPLHSGYSFWSRLLKEILFHTSLRSLFESYVLRALICRIVPRVHLRWAQKFSSGNYPFFSSELRNQEFLLIWQKCRFPSLMPVTCETSHTGKSQTVPLCPI